METHTKRPSLFSFSFWRSFAHSISLSLSLALPLDTKSNWIFWCEREKSGRSIWQTRKEWRHTQNVLAYFLFRFGAILLSLSLSLSASSFDLNTKSNWIFWCEREKGGRSRWQTRKEWRHTQNALDYFLFRFGAIFLFLSLSLSFVFRLEHKSKLDFLRPRKFVCGDKNMWPTDDCFFLSFERLWRVQSYKTFYSSVKCYCLYLHLRIQAGYGLMEWAPFL